MLRLNLRECVIGEKYSGKKVKDEEARTLKISLEEIPIDREEFNALLGDAHAYEVLYREDGQPRLKSIKALELEKAWEGAHVFVHIEEQKIALKDAKLTKIKLAPREEDGKPVLSVNVEAQPILDAKFLEIVKRVGAWVSCEIRADNPADQKELPLNRHGEGEQPETTRKHNRRRGARKHASREQFN